MATGDAATRTHQYPLCMKLHPYRRGFCPPAAGTTRSRVISKGARPTKKLTVTCTLNLYFQIIKDESEQVLVDTYEMRQVAVEKEATALLQSPSLPLKDAEKCTMRQMSPNRPQLKRHKMK